VSRAEYQRQWRAKNPEKAREYSRRQRESDPDLIRRQKRESWARNYVKNRALLADRDARYNRARPEVKRAQLAVGRAIRAGRLMRQPCVKCGAINSHGHHADYAKPLEVVWLCPVHHRQAQLLLE
jgi:hypothetical protein